jgi:hypothetical protein
MLGEDDKLLKRLELYFDDQQADLALFSAILKVTFLLREDILTELEASLLKAQVGAARDRPLADLPVVKDDAGHPPRHGASFRRGSARIAAMPRCKIAEEKRMRA